MNSLLSPYRFVLDGKMPSSEFGLSRDQGRKNCTVFLILGDISMVGELCGFQSDALMSPCLSELVPVSRMSIFALETEKGQNKKLNDRLDVLKCDILGYQ